VGSTKCVTLMMVLTLVAGSTFGATLRVDDDSRNDPGPGDPLVSDPLEDGSVRHPYDAIQEAIEAAFNGDVVVIADGTYSGLGNKDLDFGGRAITVRSVSGDPNAAIIDCQGAGRGFYFHTSETSSSIIDGLTVTNGQAGPNSPGDDQGGAVLIRSASPTILNSRFINNNATAGAGGIDCHYGSPAITNCIFAGNDGSWSGAMGFWPGSSSPVISDCVITGNVGTSGAGIYCSYADAVIRNCTISANLGDGVNLVNGSDSTLINCVISGNSTHGIDLWSSAPTFENCIVINNGNDGLFLNGSSDPILTNCTIADNAQSAIDCFSGIPTVTNCILWGNSNPEISVSDPNTLVVTYCNVEGGWLSGVGNIDSDPMFIGGGDYHLQSGSPSIDAGTNTPIGGLPADDIEGNPRIADGDLDTIAVVDMGAYELPETIITAPVILFDPTSIQFTAIEGDPNIADQVVVIRNAGVGTLNWSISGIPAWLSVLPASGTSSGEDNPVVLGVDLTGLTPGDYSSTLIISDPGAQNHPAELPVNLLYVSDGIRVPGDYTTIQAAIDAAVSGDTVLIDDGIYTGIGNRDLDYGDKAITVRSVSGDPNRCIIDCQGLGRGFSFSNSEGSNSIVQGLTITNGNAQYGGAIYCSASNPTISNCRLISNTATSYGGGLYCTSSSPALIDCIIAGNAANSLGGGIYGTGSSMSLANCLIVGNTASSGGGIRCYSNSDVTMTNCTFSGNSASSNGGGIYCTSSNPVLTNNVIWGNTPQAIHVASGVPDVSYSNVEGSWTGTGNIAIDPQFVDPDGADNIASTWADNDYRLALGSLCIDSGTNTPSGGLPDNDLDGNPRIVDGDGDLIQVVDMGAYEYNTGSFAPMIDANPTSFAFTALIGGPDPDDQFLTISNAGLGELNWQISGDPNWLSVSPNSGTVTSGGDDVTLSVDITGLSIGAYAATLSVSDPNADNSPVEVPISLNIIIPSPEISVEPNSVAFVTYPSTTQLPTQELVIRNSGTGILDWVVTGQGDWLNVDPNSGTSSGEDNPVTLTADPNGLTPGTYMATLTVSDQSDPNLTLDVPVSIEVREALVVPTDYPTIQAAIDMAVIGDTILLLDGTYTGVGNKDLDYLGKAITVQSLSGDPNAVIIDCEGEGRGFHFHNGEGTGSVLKGVTITNGNQTSYGGGAYCDGTSPVFENCIFVANKAGSSGGGVAMRNSSSPRFTECSFISNISSSGGGGVYCTGGSPTFLHCTFRGNRMLYENYAGGAGGGGGYASGASTTFIHCDFIDNRAPNGGGWRSYQSDTTFDYCRFLGNTANAGNGGGTDQTGGTLVLNECEFDDNRAYQLSGFSSGDGGAVNTYEIALNANRCTFTNNLATSAGGALYLRGCAQQRFTNCVIANNTASFGTAMYILDYYNECTTEQQFVNCTISNNDAPDDPATSYAVYLSKANARFNNCIIWGNNTESAISYSSDLIVTYSNIEGGTGASWYGDGCIDTDPFFIAASDWHLESSSPCIDTGTDMPTGGLPLTDANGRPRTIDGDLDEISLPDMGAFEYDPDLSLLATSTNKLTFRANVSDITLPDQSLVLWNAGTSTISWDISGAPNWLTLSPSSGQVGTSPTNVNVSVNLGALSFGSYETTLKVTSGDAINSPVEVQVAVTIYDALTVPVPYTTIQSAIDAALDGDVVELADGVYRGPGNKDLDYRGKAIMVRSESGHADQCIIDCEGSGRGVAFTNWEGPDSVLYGITILNGYVDTTSNGGGNGAGVYSDYASPTIINCIFRSNNAYGTFAHGGGLASLYGTPLVINCAFLSNTAPGGGGIDVLRSDATIVGCTFIGNAATTSYTVKGGAIRDSASSPSLLNNCVLWWNYPDQLSYAAGTSVTSCLIQPGWDQWASNIRYPMLTSDGHLTAFSDLCLDAGDLGLIPADTYDLDNDGDPNEPIPFDIDGDTRIANDFVDIGADEFIDSDLDGLPDWWEAKYFGDTLAADPNDDADNDGLINVDEYEDFSSDPNAAPIYVDKSNSDPNADGTLGNPFSTIQLALDAATDGDTVIVLDSVDNYYTGAGNSELDFRGRRIVLRADGNITLSTETSVPAVLVDSVRGTGSALIGFTLVSDSVEAGSGFDLSSYSLFFHDCTFLCDGCSDLIDHSLRLSQGYIALGDVQLGKTEDPNASGLVGQGSAEIERAWVHLDGDVSLVNSELTLKSAALFPDDLQNPQSTIDIDSASTMFITGSQANAEPTVMYTNVTGQGDLIVDDYQTLHVRGRATIDMTPNDLPGGCGDLLDPNNTGTIVVGPFGTLECLDECTIRDTIVYLTGDDDLGNVTEITNSQLILDEKTPGYGGYLKIGKNAYIQCNRIDSYGDRYLSFDPDPTDPNRPTFLDNKIYVTMTQGLGADQARPFEIRNQDMDNTLGGGASGAYQLASSAGDSSGLGYADPWALEELTILADAEVVLSNRQGFDFQDPNITLPEALYVKKLILHEGATLNTGLQRMYYQSLVDQNGQPLARDPNEPSLPMANGSQIVDEPLLGFSVTVIHLDDDPNTLGIDESQQEFEYRVERRVYDEAGTPIDPNDPNCVGGDVTLRDPNWIAGSVLEMRTAAAGCAPATSVSAKGQFSRAGSETITVDFDYLWRGEGELVVYASSSPRVSECPNGDSFGDCHVEIGRMIPPADGRPGSINETRFATFDVTFPANLLDFSRGVYVELELLDDPNHLGEAMIWIDRWDPQVRCSTLTCLDLTGNNSVSDDDFLVLVAEAGVGVPSGKGCLDAPFTTDSYVDLGDLLAIETVLSADPAPQNYCEPPLPGAGLGTPVDLQSMSAPELLIAGKSSSLDDGLYGFSDSGQASTASGSQPGQGAMPLVQIASLNPPQRPASAGPAHGNSRLVKDRTGIVYQLHATQGLIRLDTAERVIAPFSDDDPNGRTVYVGVQQTGDWLDYATYGYPQGLPIQDVAFDPEDPDVVYVVPVVVESSPTCSFFGEPCPYYKAAAKLTRQGDGSYQVTNVYGYEPAYDPDSNAEPPVAGDTYIQGQREIEVNSDGHVLVLSAMGQTINNDWLLVYDAASGTELRRVSLMDVDPNLANPSTLVASRHTSGRVYMSSQLDNDPGDNLTTLYRCTLNPSAPSDPLVITDTIQVQCGNVLPPDNGYGHLLLTTEVLENPNDGSLRLLGLAMARVDPEVPANDPQLFCVGCPLETQPWLAVVPAGSTGPIDAELVSGSVPAGEELVLPLSAVQFVGGDISGDDLVNGQDLDLFEACMAGPELPSTCEAIIQQRANSDMDTDVDVADFERLQQLVGT
jgi:parallel beta-helix repeat protein